MSMLMDRPTDANPPASSPISSPVGGTPLPAPRRGRLNDTDVLAVLSAFAFLVVGTWSAHGGLRALGAWDTAWTSLASLSGLLTSAVALVALVLVARPRSIERRYGLDRLFVWHRILGDSMGLLLAVHIAVSLVAWSRDLGFADAVSQLTGAEPYMALATVGAFLVGVVVITSLKSVRRTLSYETWWFVHLLAYAGFAIAFSHTITLGTDFADDPVARWIWISLHVAVAALLLVSRWGATVMSLVRPLRIRSVTRLNPDTVAVEIGGKSLRRRSGAAGQFCFLRPMARGLWWQAHPFSLSAAPTIDTLRFTIKDRGDATSSIGSLRPGRRVAVEGPFGAVTPEVLEGRKALFVVGGVGVAPAVAMLQSLGPGHEPVVLYRAHSESDLVHVDELHDLCERLGGRLRTLVGPTARLAVKDPFSASVLSTVVPDIADRGVVVCGPDRLVHAARAGAKACGVPPSNIHSEHSWW